MKIQALVAVAAPVFLACALSSAAARGAPGAGGQGAQEQRPSGTPSGSKTSGDARDLYLKGQAALQGGDLDAAEKAFRQVLAIDPRSAGAYSNLGVIAMRRKDWDQALKLLEKAAKLAPTVSGVRLNIGLVYYREGDYEAAIVPLSSVLRDQPDSEQARYLLGLCDVFTEKFSDAVSVLEPLWAQKSEDFMYLYVLSMAANGAGQKELDEKVLARLIEVGGDRAEFHLLMGKAYLYRQETEKAVAELSSTRRVSVRIFRSCISTWGSRTCEAGTAGGRKRSFAGTLASNRICRTPMKCSGNFICGKGRTAKRKVRFAKRCAATRGWQARTTASPRFIFGKGNTSKR